MEIQKQSDGYKQKSLGAFFMGRKEVELFITDGADGSFYTSPERGKLPRIKVGMQAEWRHVVMVLIHEAAEATMDDMYLRFAPSHAMSQDHADYLFSFNHPQFSEICARVADFLTPVLPLVAAEWKRWPKK